MTNKEMEDNVINAYQRDETMMILVFAQWCVNHDLDPTQLYHQAYPTQEKNQVLDNVLELTVPKEEAGEIPLETVLNVLNLFGNGDLAFVVSEASQQQKR